MKPLAAPHKPESHPWSISVPSASVMVFFWLSTIHKTRAICVKRLLLNKKPKSCLILVPFKAPDLSPASSNIGITFASSTAADSCIGSINIMSVRTIIYAEKFFPFYHGDVAEKGQKGGNSKCFHFSYFLSRYAVANCEVAYQEYSFLYFFKQLRPYGAVDDVFKSIYNLSAWA